jgi:hypothetical protein
LLQECLHVTPSIGDQQNKHIVVADPIDDAVWFEKDLAVLLDSQGEQFLWACPSVRVFRKTLKDLFDLMEGMLRLPWAVVSANVIPDAFQVAGGGVGQDSPGHSFCGSSGRVQRSLTEELFPLFAEAGPEGFTE